MDSTSVGICQYCGKEFDLLTTQSDSCIICLNELKNISKRLQLTRESYNKVSNVF